MPWPGAEHVLQGNACLPLHAVTSACALANVVDNPLLTWNQGHYLIPLGQFCLKNMSDTRYSLTCSTVFLQDWNTKSLPQLERQSSEKALQPALQPALAWQAPS